MRRHGLLTIEKSERGSAPLESLFAMLFVVMLALGAIEVALVLYARNVISASAHEGARAGVELGRDPQEAAELARRTVERSAGGLVDELEVGVRVASTPDRSTVHVTVAGTLRVPGPVALPFPARATATATTEARVP